LCPKFVSLAAHSLFDDLVAGGSAPAARSLVMALAVGWRRFVLTTVENQASRDGVVSSSRCNTS
jgi:hypothetical protein